MNVHGLHIPVHTQKRLTKLSVQSAVAAEIEQVEHE